MKSILLTGLISLLASQAHAYKLDINPFIDKLEASYVYNQHGDHMAGAHYKAFEYPAEKPWAFLNGGVIWDTEGDTQGVGGGFVSASFSVDRVGNWAWNRSGLSSRVKMNFKLPKLKVGPFGGYVHRFGWLYGVHVIKGFGG